MMTSYSKIRLQQGSHGSGKSQGKMEFCKSQGNIDECQGNLKNKAKVREMSGNFEIVSGNFALGLFWC